MFYNIPYQCWSFHPILLIDWKYLKITNIHFLDFEVVWWFLSPVDGFLSPFWSKNWACFFHGFDALCTKINTWRSNVPLPQVNDSVLRIFWSSQPYLWWLQYTEEARTCEAWFQLTFRPQKWNLKAHMWWYQLSPFPSSNVAICDAAPPRQHSPILRYSALLRYSVLCFNSSAQCNWHDIETMAE